jgi:hypothetical protein
MSVRRYGIYLAYPPKVDLRVQGLGRHLAELLKAAQERNDLRFVIACPSWMKSSIDDLCEENDIAHDSFDVVSPRMEPLFLRAYEIWLAFRSRRRRTRLRYSFSAGS